MVFSDGLLTPAHSVLGSCPRNRGRRSRYLEGHCDRYRRRYPGWVILHRRLPRKTVFRFRILLSRIAIGCLLYGYNDVIITPDLARIIVDQVHRYLLSPTVSPQSRLPSSPIDDVVSESPDNGFSECPVSSGSGSVKSDNEGYQFMFQLSKLEEAYGHKVLYIIGKEMRIKTDASHVRKASLYVFLRIRDNTRNKMPSIRVPTDKLIEVGFLKEI